MKFLSLYMRWFLFVYRAVSAALNLCGDSQATRHQLAVVWEKELPLNAYGTTLEAAVKNASVFITTNM